MNTKKLYEIIEKNKKKQAIKYYKCIKNYLKYDKKVIGVKLLEIDEEKMKED